MIIIYRPHGGWTLAPERSNLESMKTTIACSLFAILSLAACSTVDRVVAGPPVLYACADGSMLTAQPGAGRRHFDVLYKEEGQPVYKARLASVAADFGERFSVADGTSLWLNENKALLIRPGIDQALCQIQP